MMIEFCAFFVIPFDENTPPGEGTDAIEHAMKTKELIEEECLNAFHEIIPVEKRHDHQVWAQSRVDLDMRIIGASLRLPVEKGGDRHVVPTVVHDDFFYWDFEELSTCMKAMHDAVERVAASHGCKAHTAFADVRYRL